MTGAGASGRRVAFLLIRRPLEMENEAMKADNPVRVRKVSGAEIISVHEPNGDQHWFIALHNDGKNYTVVLEDKLVDEALKQLGLNHWPI